MNNGILGQYRAGLWNGIQLGIEQVYGKCILGQYRAGL